MIKDNCSELFEPLRSSNFQGLLMAVVSVTKNRDERFFKSLNHASVVLKRGFELLLEMKLTILTEENIANLVSGNIEFFTSVRFRPSIIKVPLN
jgi:hypothetical protein